MRANSKDVCRRDCWTAEGVIGIRFTNFCCINLYFPAGLIFLYRLLPTVSKTEIKSIRTKNKSKIPPLILTATQKGNSGNSVEVFQFLPSLY